MGVFPECFCHDPQKAADLSRPQQVECFLMLSQKLIPWHCVTFFFVLIVAGACQTINVQTSCHLVHLVCGSLGSLRAVVHSGVTNLTTVDCHE